MDNTLLTGALLMIAAILVGVILGMTLHRRVHAAQVADIDGDIAALRQKLKDSHDAERLTQNG